MNRPLKARLTGEETPLSPRPSNPEKAHRPADRVVGVNRCGFGDSGYVLGIY